MRVPGSASRAGAGLREGVPRSLAHGSRAVAGGGAGVRPFLRRTPDDRKSWRAHAQAPEYEDAPSPARLQSEADPEDAGLRGPVRRGRSGGSAAASVARRGRRSAGRLRLLDGGLIPKAEKGGAVVQFRIDGDGLLKASGGVRLYHEWGLCLPVEIAPK